MPGVTAIAIRGTGVIREEVRPTADSTVASRRPAYDQRLIPDRDTTRATRVRPYPATVAVSDGYFALLGRRVRQGRSFAPDDQAGSSPVTVVSASVAKLLWGDSNPLGHTLQVGARGAVATVVGVVDDLRELRGGRNGFSDAPLPTLYFSSRQAESSCPEILATGPGDVLALRSRIVGLVRAADPSMLLLRDVTLASQLDEAFLVTRVFGGLILAFALSALVLSVVGIYGVVAFGISRRTREIGVRIALGGTVRDVIRLVVPRCGAIRGDRDGDRSPARVGARPSRQDLPVRRLAARSRRVRRGVRPVWFRRHCGVLPAGTTCRTRRSTCRVARGVMPDVGGCSQLRDHVERERLLRGLLLRGIRDAVDAHDEGDRALLHRQCGKRADGRIDRVLAEAAAGASSSRQGYLSSLPRTPMPARARA